MGSQKICDVKPDAAMAEHKKSIKELLKKPFQALFLKDKKEKEKKKNVVEKAPVKIHVDEILDNFKKLEIDKKDEDSNDEEDELKNFEYKIIKDERSSARIDSHSSEDSGFADKCSDSEEEEDKKDDTPETEQKKTKKKQTVVLHRGPVKHRVADFTPQVHPYVHEQISQINRQTFSGGQVIVNQSIQPPIDEVLKGVDINVRMFEQKSNQEKAEDWDIAQEFLNIQSYQEEPRSDPIPFDINHFINDTKYIPKPEYHDGKNSVFLTPPRSENSLSPISDTHNTYYPTTDYTMSPDMSIEYEKYQEITPLEEFPSCVTDFEKVAETKPERASMTMKQFKDMQKEIASGFAKMECCQENRKPCNDVLKEHIRKLKIDERKDLCLKVAQMEMEHVHGVLQYILGQLSSGSAGTADEDVQLALLTLICEKVLALDPTFFVNEQGFSLLKTAVFRCHGRPLLTRYLVQCIRVVTRADGYKSTKGQVFHEVDARGDNVLSACARAGDTHAGVLAELVRARPADTPLFDVHHVNADGYTALHIACMEHSEAAPHLHTVHVLLQHANADLWKGDIKGGDTAVHVAVNAAGCSLPLLLLLFRPLPRPEWKRLAHAHNRSSVSPLEYARSAMKSASRQNYPAEVLDFLKKCR
ncbi:uncharacterized protein LOC121736353 [Aricia agestis]|uniref:uncharacterized protein LOC121736353 n=1 Tax=Aricia agestis TaxID=91739 RepID=UPI001C206B31|nr:uncharacterized protein LOC121736353 [Aricia agestis]XP_041983430.1 uncharacterized protein LOC121736353 [Aricia agestis]